MTTTTINLTYPISPMILTRNTTELRRRVKQHLAADAVIQGTYWDGQRGCFIGCLNHSRNPAHAEAHYGLPMMVQKIAEAIFERLPAEEARQFFAAIPDAVGGDGKDLTCVGWQFMAQVLRGMPPTPAQGLAHQVADGLELLAAGEEWPDAANVAYAAAAAYAVADAAVDAAYRAAYAAAEAANAAAAAAVAAAAYDAAYAAAAAYDAANAAANAANAANDAAAANAAHHASLAAQRDLLLKLISVAPVIESP